jgi:BCL2-related ovarian killer protein
VTRDEKHVYTHLQVAVTITNEKSVSSVLSSVARNLLKTDVTWGKIASLYCVAGGLAIDCVQQGHPEYLFGIVETMGLVIERDAATWIAQQGGWVIIIHYVVTSLFVYIL